MTPRERLAHFRHRVWALAAHRSHDVATPQPDLETLPLIAAPPLQPEIIRCPTTG